VRQSDDGVELNVSAWRATSKLGVVVVAVERAHRGVDVDLHRSLVVREMPERSSNSKIATGLGGRC
jgi:hypothetical protein